MTRRNGIVALSGIGVVMGTLVFPGEIARADLGFWSTALVGTWRNPANGDKYRFGSNATYTFTAGPAKARSGQVSHSGFWKIVAPTEQESGGSMEGPVALVLSSRTRVVRRQGRNVTLSSRRSFRLVVDVAFGKGDHEVDRNHYFIGKSKWVRVG